MSLCRQSLTLVVYWQHKTNRIKYTKKTQTKLTETSSTLQQLCRSKLKYSNLKTGKRRAKKTNKRSAIVQSMFQSSASSSHQWQSVQAIWINWNLCTITSYCSSQDVLLLATITVPFNVRASVQDFIPDADGTGVKEVLPPGAAPGRGSSLQADPSAADFSHRADFFLL